MFNIAIRYFKKTFDVFFGRFTLVITLLNFTNWYKYSNFKKLLKNNFILR